MNLFNAVFFVLLVGVARSNIISNIVNYQTDYTVAEMTDLLLKGSKLTVDALFNIDLDVPIDQDVTFWAVNRNNSVPTQVFLNDANISTKLDLSKPVAFVIHGWIDNVNRTWVKDILNDYPIYYDINVIAVDWSRLANYEYTMSATKYVYKVGAFLSVFISFLNSQGITNDEITLVGHSLGGQISGYTGYLQNGTIAEIYGLDPAGPLFCAPILVSTDKRLDPTDAKYVQVIMTTAGMLGCLTVCGNETFYPNGGFIPQTGCVFPMVQGGPAPEMIACSHSQATNFFRWSLNPANNLDGVQCSNWATYKLGFCDKNQKDHMGPRHLLTSGYFYLTTSSTDPAHSI